ncbi:MAG: ComEA family DNA-binding protein [Dehalococcoidales bacterium]
MAEGSNGKLWASLITILLIAIAVSGFFTWQGLSGHQPLEIELTPSPPFNGEIYIGGNVNNPGFYPFNSDDRISDLLQASGGINNTGSGQWRLDIYEGDIEATPQRININRAEVWLLKTLPGIGDTRAEAIVNYRAQNGYFRNINELTSVPGIGSETLAQVKLLITVAD